MSIYEKWRHFLLFSKKYKNIQFLPYFSLKSFFSLFCHFPIKIKVKIQNEILRVKKLLDFIFYSKKGGLGLMIITCTRVARIISPLGVGQNPPLFFHKLQKILSKIIIKENLKNLKKENMIRKMMIDLKNTSLAWWYDLLTWWRCTGNDH